MCLTTNFVSQFTKPDGVLLTLGEKHDNLQKLNYCNKRSDTQRHAVHVEIGMSIPDDLESREIQNTGEQMMTRD